MSKFEIILTVILVVLAVLALPFIVERVYTTWDAPEVPPYSVGCPEYDRYCREQVEAREAYIERRKAMWARYCVYSLNY